MFGDVVCLLMLILFRKLNNDSLFYVFYVSDTYVWIHVFAKQLF